jgi:hypothetical protein
MVKKSRVFWIIFLVLAVFLLSVCSKKKSTEPEPPDKWTILGYFDGNNSQDIISGKSYVIKDVQDMELVGSTEEVQIIVMVSSINTEGNCNYYFIETYLDTTADSISSEVLDSLGRKDMSDPQTLRDFIEYGVEHYPADHYMLIINDRGSGWKGICSDQRNGDGEMMTLPELSSALFGYHFEIILFNAPYMSMVEVAYQLKDKANYLVALESTLREKNILSASKWLQALANNPGISSKRLADIIATAIHNTAEVYNTICAIDLSKVDALTSKIADFGSLVKSHIGDDWKEVLDARKTSPSFPILYYSDLKKFCQNIQKSTDLDSTIKNAAQAVENANDLAVVKMLSDKPELGYGGLCIHFPHKSDKFDSTDYVQLAFAVSNWHIFLSEFIKAYTEANMGSIRVTSDPTGAWIFLDGDSTGLVTDTTIHGVPTGYHTVKLVKDGYNEWVWRMVFVQANSTTVLPCAKLIPLSPPRESISEL